MPDGGGRLYESTFHLDQATASEVKELQTKLRQIKRGFRARLLRNFSLGRKWEDRWKLWNRMFPDLAFPSADAMRHAKDYLEKRRYVRTTDHRKPDKPTRL